MVQTVKGGLQMERKKLLRESLEIWRYLARTGKDCKPDFAYKWLSGCPFCEEFNQVVIGKVEDSCVGCWLPTTIGAFSNTKYACERQPTYYRRWYSLRLDVRKTRKRRSWAWAMVNAFETELLGFRS
jgi:hypothetical protein